MREDWNARAQEDAFYYVAFGRREQSDGEFDETANEVVLGLLHELKRVPVANSRARRALEIGCGPGRLLKPMSKYFGEIHGIDVSDEMIRLARQRLTGIPHAHAHAGSGSDLAPFADSSFDFVYSYAVFQHIPSREVVFNYLNEAVRVLKPGGLVRVQLNGLPKTAKSYDTWSGVRIDGDEIRAFCRQHGLLLLALEGLQTQYMWTTWLKPASGMMLAAPPPEPVRIRRVTNAFSSEPVAPASGRYASISLWTENLPIHADLLSLELRLGGEPCILTYLGRPESDGLRQLNALLPAGIPTGLVPLELQVSGEVARSRLRVVPSPSPVPRVVTATDGIDLMSEAVHTGCVKLHVEEFLHPERVSVSVAGLPVRNLEFFCTDPMPPRHEINFDLPEGLAPGAYEAVIQYGNRRLAPLPLTIQGR